MKTPIILFLSCMSLLGADTDIQVITTSQTIEKSVVFTRDVFTRAGETNLVRSTMLKSDKLEFRLQQIYHGGLQLAVVSTRPGSVYVETAASSPYSVSFEYGRSNNLSAVAVWTTNDMVVDAFDCKDGILSPIKGSLLQSVLGAKRLEMRSNTALEPTPTAP